MSKRGKKTLSIYNVEPVYYRNYFDANDNRLYLSRHVDSVFKSYEENRRKIRQAQLKKGQQTKRENKIFNDTVLVSKKALILDFN